MATKYIIDLISTNTAIVKVLEGESIFTLYTRVFGTSEVTEIPNVTNNTQLIYEDLSQRQFSETTTGPWRSAIDYEEVLVKIVDQPKSQVISSTYLSDRARESPVTGWITISKKSYLLSLINYKGESPDPRYKVVLNYRPLPLREVDLDLSMTVNITGSGGGQVKVNDAVVYSSATPASQSISHHTRKEFGKSDYSLSVEVSTTGASTIKLMFETSFSYIDYNYPSLPYSESISFRDEEIVVNKLVPLSFQLIIDPETLYVFPLLISEATPDLILEGNLELYQLPESLVIEDNSIYCDRDLQKGVIIDQSVDLESLHNVEVSRSLDGLVKDLSETKISTTITTSRIVVKRVDTNQSNQLVLSLNPHYLGSIDHDELLEYDHRISVDEINQELSSDHRIEVSSTGNALEKYILNLTEYEVHSYRLERSNYDTDVSSEISLARDRKMIEVSSEVSLSPRRSTGSDDSLSRLELSKSKGSVDCIDQIFRVYETYHKYDLQSPEVDSRFDRPKNYPALFEDTLVRITKEPQHVLIQSPVVRLYQPVIEPFELEQESAELRMFLMTPFDHFLVEESDYRVDQLVISTFEVKVEESSYLTSKSPEVRTISFIRPLLLESIGRCTNGLVERFDVRLTKWINTRPNDIDDRVEYTNRNGFIMTPNLRVSKVGRLSRLEEYDAFRYVKVKPDQFTIYSRKFESRVTKIPPIMLRIERPNTIEYRLSLVYNKNALDEQLEVGPIRLVPVSNKNSVDDNYTLFLPLLSSRNKPGSTDLVEELLEIKPKYSKDDSSQVIELTISSKEASSDFTEVVFSSEALKESSTEGTTITTDLGRKDSFDSSLSSKVVSEKVCNKLIDRSYLDEMIRLHRDIRDGGLIEDTEIGLTLKHRLWVVHKSGQFDRIILPEVDYDYETGHIEFKSQKFTDNGVVNESTRYRHYAIVSKRGSGYKVGEMLTYTTENSGMISFTFRVQSVGLNGEILDLNLISPSVSTSKLVVPPADLIYDEYTGGGTGAQAEVGSEIDNPYDNTPPPPIDHTHGNYDREFIRPVSKYPIDFGESLNKSEDEVDLAVMIDMTNILILFWLKWVGEFYYMSGPDAVLALLNGVLEYMTLEESRDLQNRYGVRESYDRTFRWFRWEAEKVIIYARNDRLLRGNYWVNFFVDQLLSYFEDHHFNVTPLYSMLQVYEQTLELSDQSGVTWVLDKIKGRRHQLLGDHYTDEDNYSDKFNSRREGDNQ